MGPKDLEDKEIHLVNAGAVAKDSQSCCFLGAGGPFANSVIIGSEIVRGGLRLLPNNFLSATVIILHSFWLFTLLDKQPDCKCIASADCFVVALCTDKELRLSHYLSAPPPTTPPLS